jgi:hypothetical protein
MQLVHEERELDNQRTQQGGNSPDGQLEIELDRGALVLALEGVQQLDVDLCATSEISTR